MIGKIFAKNSGSFKGRIFYIFGKSKHDHAITKIEQVDSNCFTGDPLPSILNGDDSVINEMVMEFDQVEKFRSLSIDSEKQIKPVFHAVLSIRPGEFLDKKQWQLIVRKYLKDLGFPESCKYVSVLHEDTDHQHVHIVANRIRFEDGFRVVSDSNERTKTVDSVSEIEDIFGLIKSPKPSETWGVNISKAELESSIKNNEMPLKHKMIAKIAGAIEKTRMNDGDMFDFVRALRSQKVYIHLTLDDNGQPKGISYEHNGHVISGRKLKRARLTWQKLTTQEGIHYDPETVQELQREISRRDDGDNELDGEYRYYIFYGKGQRHYIKFKSRQELIQEIIMAILALLLAIFGISFSVMEGKQGSWYDEYKPGKPFNPETNHHP